MNFRPSLASFPGTSAGFCRQPLLLTACALAGLGFSQAGIVGLWEFNDPADLGKATIGSPLALTGSVTSVPGAVAGDGAAATDPGDFFTVTNPIGANGSSGSPTRTNTYTLVMDFKVPLLATYSALFDFNLGGDGDYFIRKFANQNELGWASFAMVGAGAPAGSPNQTAGTFQANVWYRMVLAIDNGVSNRSAVYLNGTLIGSHGVGTLNDAGRSIGTTFRVFDDPNGSEESTAHISRLALYDTRLEDSEIAALGNTGAVTEPVGVWDGGGDGVTWTQAANWSRNIVPGSTDDVVIDVAGTPTIVVGSSVTVKSITCAEDLSVTGGTFKVIGPSNVTRGFTLAGGVSLIAEGASASFTASGATTINNANVYAKLGAVITLPGVTNYEWTGGSGYGFANLYLQAEGVGSVLSMPNLLGIQGNIHGNYVLIVRGLTGGSVLMPSLTSVVNSVYLGAEGTNTSLNVSTLSSAAFTAGGVYAINGGAVTATSLASVVGGAIVVDSTSTMGAASLATVSGATVTLTGTVSGLLNLALIDSCSVVVKGTTPLPLLESVTNSTIEFRGGTGSYPSISNIYSSSVYAKSGAVITLPGVTNYEWTGGSGYGFANLYLQAEGVGSVLSMPNLLGIQGNIHGNYVLIVRGLTGGSVLMPSLTSVVNSVYLGAEGTNSSLNVSALSSAAFTAGGVHAINGGAVTATSLASVVGGAIVVDSTSTMGAASLATVSGATVTLTGTVSGLLNLALIDSCNVVVKGTTPLPLLESVTNSTIEFRGGAGSFPSISDITSSSVYVTSGAVITLTGVSNYTWPGGGPYGFSNLYLQAQGAGTVLSMPNLITMTGNQYGNNVLIVRGISGGRVELPALASVTGPILFQADGVDSYLDLPVLKVGRFYNDNTSNGFQAINGGRIAITGIEAMSNGRIQFTGANSFVDVGTNPGVPVVGATPGSFGPVSYRSFQDSPFREVPFTSFHLEDGEDGAINTPGVTFTNQKPGGSVWGVRAPSAATDSVDGDDGNIDGNGSAGRSLSPLTNDGSEGDGVTVSFNSATLGYLPTHAGFMWTDGSAGQGVLAEFFDGAGRLITSIGPVLVGDSASNGTAADDHFFGAVNRSGIASFRVRVLGGTGTMELDHLQYGTTTGVQTPVTPRYAADLKLVRGGPVNDMLRLSDGSLVAGGAFSKVNAAAHRSLVKLAANGAVAAGWTTPVLAGGGQEVPVVNALAADASRLFLGGDFANLAGVAKANLCVVNPDTGLAGAAFNSYPNKPVVALALNSNILFAATADKVFGYNLSTTPTFNLVAPWPGAVWVDAGERIESVLLLGAHLYVAGRFDSLQGQPRTHLARVNATTGEIDLTWNPSLPVGWQISQILTDGTNLFLRGKDLTLLDTTASFVRKLTVSPAALDGTWSPVTGVSLADAAVHADFLYLADRDGNMKRVSLTNGSPDATWSQSLEGFATAITSAPDGLLAMGPFRDAGGSAAFGGVKLDLATGAKMPAFSTTIISTGVVHAMARQTDGKTMIAGDFQEIQGQPVMNFARLEAGADRFDPGWKPRFSGGAVRVIDISGDEIHIGGDFIRADGLSVSLARFTMLADGGPDGGWLPAVSEVGSIAVNPDLVYAGGRFPNASGDIWLGRMDRRGIGATEPGWGRPIRNDNGPVKIKTMALDGDFLYLGGDFTTVDLAGRVALARVKIADGTIATSWNPTVFRTPSAGLTRVEKLIPRDGFIYFAGAFSTVQGKTQSHLARITMAEGEFDTTWRPVVTAPLNDLYFSGSGILAGSNDLLFYQTHSPTTPARVLAVADGPVRKIMTEEDRVIVGGGFSNFGGVASPGFGATPLTGQARVVFSGRFVHFYPDDATGAYAGGFKLDSMTGGLLVDPTTGAFITSGGQITLAQGAAGLLWLKNPDAIDPRIKVSANAGTLAGDLEPTIVNPSELPAFAFSQASMTVREGEMASPFVEYHGTAQIGSVSYEILPLTAVPFDGLAGDYVDAPVRVNFSWNPRRGVFEGPISIPILEDGETESPEDFYVRLIEPGGGIALGRQTLLKLTVIDNPPTGSPPAVLNPLLTQAPTALPISSGTHLTVNLTPSTPVARWRLWGESFWRDAGTTVSLLQAGGRHRVDYQPLENYKALLSPDSAFITDGQTASLDANYQLDTDLLLPGRVQVHLDPDSVAGSGTEASRGQWRLAGETTWRNAGTITPLPPGKHLVEFKEGITDWIAPAPRFVQISPEEDSVIRAVYTPDRAANGPVPLPFTGSPSVQSAPYQFVGQIESSFGYATGTAVSEQVVLTAARAMWNPESLTIATRLAWFHQQDSAHQRAVPRGPRNVLILSGYASQRDADDEAGTSPGSIGPLASDSLDAAVLYFLGSTAARGGYSGYLADFSKLPGFHPWLLGDRSRILCGYPASGVAAGDHGIMHATAASTAPLDPLQNQIYQTSAIEGRPGMEGAPLMVQHANGAWYPAAIYLGESGSACFRAIDRQLVQLIYRAEAIANILSNGGTGGGDEFVNQLTGDDYPIGFVTASLIPGEGRWRILDRDTGEPLTGWFFSGEIIPLVSDRYLIAFEPISGLANPTPTPVEAVSGQLAPPLQTYYPVLISYDDWKAGVFNAQQILNSLISGPGADPDGDGFENRMEFALGLPPLSTTMRSANTTSVIPGTPVCEIRSSDSGKSANIIFLRRYETPVLDVEYRVELSDSPTGPWVGNIIPVEVRSLDQYWQEVSIPMPLSSNKRARFGRVSVIPKNPTPP